MKKSNGRTRTVEITLPDLPHTLPGRREIIMKEIPDAFDGQPIMAFANACESILERWKKTGAIDNAQYDAGAKFRKLWEMRRLGGAQAIDYARPKVDGGLMADPISETSVNAGMELNEARKHIGAHAYEALIALVGEGMSIKSLACYSEERSQREIESYSWWVRETLSHLVKFWGLIAEGAKR